MSHPFVEPMVSIQELKDNLATNYFGVASYVMLLYDHLVTFDDEVNYIWKGNKKPIFWLFLLNRYLTPLGFTININAYTSPRWGPSVCNHFVRYEGSMTLIGISVASLMMGIRVTAIYHGNRLVKFVLGLVFLVMVGVNAWLLTTGRSVHDLVSIRRGCTMIFDPQESHGWASASAWLPLLYDTIVVVLVLARIWGIASIKIAGQFRMIRTLAHDGIMYYSVILAANLVLAIMISKSPDDLKNICAQFQLLITVTMMSRITLNLCKNMDRLEDASLKSLDIPQQYSRRASTMLAASPRTLTPPANFKQQQAWGVQTCVDHQHYHQFDLETGSVLDIRPGVEVMALPSVLRDEASVAFEEKDVGKG